MKNFNFSGFKKIAEDDKSVTMQHDKGHKMVIAIMAIPKIQREQLKMLPLAKGGEVSGISTQGLDVRHAVRAKRRGDKEMEDQSKDFAKSEAKGRMEHERIIKPNLKGLATGGKVQGYADKGNVEASDSPQDNAQQANTQTPPPVTVNVNSQPQGQSDNTQANQSSEPVAQNPAVNYGAQPTNVEAPSIPSAVPNLNSNGTMNPAAVAQNTQSAAEGQKNIDIAKGKALAEVNAGYTQGLAENEQRRQQILDDLNKHVNDFADYASNPATKINPNHYQENQSTGAKVGTAIGMLLGGFSTPFGGTNYAYDFLNKQIERDILAQKERANQQQTILGAYEHLYGEGNAAVNATKATMLDLYNQKAKQIALQLNTPQAMQNYLNFSGQAAIEKSKLLQDAAVNLNSLPGTRPVQNSNGRPSIGIPQNNQTPQQTKPINHGPDINKETGFPIYSILKPGAADQLEQLRRTPKARDEIDKIENQYNGAIQIEKVLNGPEGNGKGGLHDIMQQLDEAANIQGNPVGRVYSHIMRGVGNGVGAIPLVGAGGAALLGARPELEQEKKYNSLKTAAVTDIGTALHGILNPSDIEKIVEPNLPALNDTPQIVAQKEEAMRNSIIKAAQTSLIDYWNMTKHKSK